MKKLVLFMAVCLSLGLMSCSSSSSPKTLSATESQAYDAWSGAEQEVQDAMKSEAQKSVGSISTDAARTIATAIPTIADQAGIGSVSYTGTLSGDTTSVSFDGTYTFNNYNYTVGATTYVLNGTDASKFTIATSNASLSMYYKDVGTLTIKFNTTTVILVNDYAITVDASGNTVATGTINGVSLADMMKS